MAKKNVKSETLPVRQGDVLLLPIQEPAEGVLELAPKDPRGIVLAEGETSGHHHQVFGGAKLFRYRDTAASMSRVLVVGAEGADLRVVGGGSGGVDRHVPVSLSPGAWEVRTQRQFSAEDERQSRQVAD